MEIVAAILAIAVVLLVALLGFALRGRSENRGPTEDTLRSQFQALSQDALSKASEQFLNLAEQRLARQS